MLVVLEDVVLCSMGYLGFRRNVHARGVGGEAG
jgi:hypothetical protein